MSLKTSLATNFLTTNVTAAHGTTTAAPASAPAAPVVSDEVLKVFRGAGPAVGGLIDDAVKAGIIIVGGRPSSDSVRQKLNDKSKNLDSQDKLDNVKLQDLTSQYNQLTTTLSNITRKISDTTTAVIRSM
jgi:hypothetical protein